MAPYILDSAPNLSDWNRLIAGLPGAHILQTCEWADVKAAVGWRALPLLWRGERGEVLAAAMVLQRPLQIGPFSPNLSVMYTPRGPLLDWDSDALRSQVLDDLQRLARQSGAIFIKIDPEVVLGYGIPGSQGASSDLVGVKALEDLRRRGWLYSDEQVQFRNTVVLDLRGLEADWLSRMKQKTRYNLRLAERKGVTVRHGSAADFGLLYRMYAETALRDGFTIRPANYYQKVWDTFTRAGMCFPLVAEVEGEPVAGLVLFVYAQRAWYLYGMSREIHRDRMPNYLLQWEAMRIAKEKGALSYDLWGAPDVFDENDSMWGVFRFKEGLGGEVICTIGAYDFPCRPTFFRLYTRLLPRLLDVMRARGKARTRQEVSL